MNLILPFHYSQYGAEAPTCKHTQSDHDPQCAAARNHAQEEVVVVVVVVVVIY